MVASSACDQNPPQNNDEIFEEYFRKLNLTIPTFVTENLDLPTSLEGLTGTISWISSNQSVITDMGIIYRGTEDIKVTLTAQIKINGETKTWEKNVIVFARAPEITIGKVKQIISDQIPAATYRDLNLLTEVEGSSATITWESTNPSVISNSGKITRTSTDQEVTLNATIRTSEATELMTFKVFVLSNSLPNPKKKLTFAYMADYNYQGFDEKNAKKIDYINYSFGLIANNKLTVSHLSKIKEVIALRALGVRVVLSIGGWGADGFSDAASSPSMREEFVNSVIEVVKQYQFDGIDIDWEYPGSGVAGIKYRTEDKQNFTLLLRDLRNALDAFQPGLLLTAALGADNSIANRVEVDKIKDYLDYLHIMTYDMLDYSTNKTTHHTNLYPSQYRSFGASNAIEIYHTKGMPYNKLVLGAAFYGYSQNVTYINSNGMNNPITKSNGSVSFTTIYNNYLTNSSYTYYFDDVAKAPWLFNGTTFITFEDPTSLMHKITYVKEKNLAGIMFWEIGLDRTNTLLDAIYQNINK